MCAEFLNPEVVRDILTTGMEKSIQYVQNLEEKDFKEKVETNILSYLLNTSNACLSVNTSCCCIVMTFTQVVKHSSLC